MMEFLNPKIGPSVGSCSEVILAVETATPVCSVALFNGSELVHLREQGTGVHSTRLGGMLLELLSVTGMKMASIQTVLVSAGPGSFTGLRIGTSFLKGLFFERPVQFIRASTLPVLAYSMAHLADAYSDTLTQTMNIHAVLDARRQHLYHWNGQFEFKGGTLSHVWELQAAQARELGHIHQIIQKGDLLVGFGIERLSDGCPSSLSLPGEKTVNAGAMINAYLNPAMKSSFELADLSTFAPDYLS